MTPEERASLVVGALSLQSAWWLSDAMAAQIHEECCLAIAAAVEETREACAKIAESTETPAGHFPHDTMEMRERIAAAIRAHAAP